VGRPGKQAQHVVHQQRVVDRHRDGRLAVGERLASQEALFHRREHRGGLEEEPVPVPAHECCGRAADRDHEVRTRPAGEHADQEADDLLFGSLDDAGRSDGELGERHPGRGAPFEFPSEVGGESIEDDAATVERLQDQHMPDLCRGRTRAEQGEKRRRQNAAQECPAHPYTLQALS
jgi:hypothetical protein